jgi:hypothetical protein
MKAHTSRHAKDKTLLISMGESIGSTLGAIAGRAHAFKKALTGSPVSRTVKGEGGKLVKRVKSSGRKTGRRGSRRGTSPAKRSAGRAKSKA